MKAREFERQLARDGCVLAHTDGDHHVWRLPNGAMLVVPFGGKHSDLKPYVERRYRKLRRDGVIPGRRVA